MRLLSQWELVILNPYQPGVVEAAAESTSKHIVGRLDVSDLTCTRELTAHPVDARIVVSELFDRLTTDFKLPSQARSPFTGVLLANWHLHLGPGRLNPLLQCLKRLNVDCYLEIAPPAFLTDPEARVIDLALVKGVVCQNVTILPDGGFRNYFQMASMFRAQRALAKHAWAGRSSFMSLEIIDDGVDLSHSVLLRSFNWCRYNSVPSWVGPRAALTDAETAAAKTSTTPPLGALMWLKTAEIMKLQETWLNNRNITDQILANHEEFSKLDALLPELSGTLGTHGWDPSGVASPIDEQIVDGIDSDSSEETGKPRDPFSFSPDEESYTGLGCFQIGLHCTSADFEGLVEGQRRLRDLGLLQQLPNDDIHSMANSLRKMYENRRSRNEMGPLTLAFKDLVEQLEEAGNTSQPPDAKTPGHSEEKRPGDEERPRLRVYTGLHSGFHVDTESNFWGLFDDFDKSDTWTDIFLSAKTTDRLSTLLHTFLSKKQFSRLQCFEAECALARHTGATDDKWDLPRRITNDVQNLTPTENLLLRRRLQAALPREKGTLGARVLPCCTSQLLDFPTRDQLRQQSTEDYVGGKVNAAQVIDARLAWHREQGVSAPTSSAALAVFADLNARLPGVLVRNESHHLDRLTEVLKTILRPGRVDANADILALAIFCAFRKLAVEEIYLEVLDRNPLPNSHSDQAACFAEMFCSGSQTAAYLGLTPEAIGRVLASKYWAYYRENQPPARDDKSTDLPTAYASMNTDEDPNAGLEAAGMPLHHRLTFLGIFAVPALVDILLLTLIGRGLYLSTYMKDEEKTMATAGLMIGLLLVGAVGTWVGHGGSYYLHCMAFPAMNMFVLTRLIAGLALCIAIGLGAFIIIGATHGFYAGFIFTYYFSALSTYLTLLATLAVYQFPGFSFQSGRTAVVKCIPILLISPIVTLWAGHDIIVYPIVLAGFLVSLAFAARGCLGQWQNWYARVPMVSDTELVNWFKDFSQAKNSGVSDETSGDLAATPLPRTALMVEVNRERHRRPWVRSNAHGFVQKVAQGHEATLLLMDWYCKYSRTKMPYPYSPTWNLQVKAAVDTLKDIQKGLKLHNAFIHWREGGPEVWCGLLYFVVALMDKWVALLTGGALVGLSLADSQQYRLAVGFGLSYYLLAAIFLDAVATPLWPMANKKQNTPIKSLESLDEVNETDIKARRRLYWTQFTKFFLMHAWGMSAVTALLWVFEDGRDAIIMFLVYVGAYTGLLWYQYNRIYTGALAMGDLLTGAVVGFVLGLVLRTQTNFQFSGAVGLAAATWTTAIMSMWTAKIGLPWAERKAAVSEGTPAYYYYSGSDLSTSQLSQRTLSGIYSRAVALSDEKLPVGSLDQQNTKPTPPQQAVLRALDGLSKRMSADMSDETHTAFPRGVEYVTEAAKILRDGEMTIEILPARRVFDQDPFITTVCQDLSGLLHLLVFVESEDSSNGQQLVFGEEMGQLMAEAVIQVTTQVRFGLSSEDAVLAKSMAFTDATDQNLLSLGTKKHLTWSAAERTKAIRTGDRVLLKQLLLGIDADDSWDLLPSAARECLLKRSSGQQFVPDPSQSRWIYQHFSAKHESYQRHSTGSSEIYLVDQHIARYNLGVRLALATKQCALRLQNELGAQGLVDLSYLEKLPGAAQPLLLAESKKSLIWKMRQLVSQSIQLLRLTVKFFVIATVADPELQREIQYAAGDGNVGLRAAASLTLLGMWNFCRILQVAIIPWFLFHKRPDVQRLHQEMQGHTVTLRRKRVSIEGIQGDLTGFHAPGKNDNICLSTYSGRLKTPPTDHAGLQETLEYSRDLKLRRKEIFSKGAPADVFEYEYPVKVDSRIPLQRRCVRGNREGELVQYDERGYVSSGSYIKDNNLAKFQYSYRDSAVFDDELLRAHMDFGHIKMIVAWCFPASESPEKLDTWLPYTKVTEATFVEGVNVWHSRWRYDHRSHPTIETKLNGIPADTPPMITHDWFGILKKPSNCSFLAEDPLFSFSSLQSTVLSRALGWTRKQAAISTSLSRTHLWRKWKQSKDLDAVTARWLDESALRSEAILSPYWWRRNLGLSRSAVQFVERNADGIMARTDVDPDVSAWCTICYKISDLTGLGQGGDSKINTRKQETQMQDSDNVLHVLAHDTGTWPNEGGGVSACRRDLVNNLDSIRWHVIAENANDFGTPKFQIERSVMSLSVLSLWGLDFLTPTHGVFQSFRDSAVQQRLNNVSDDDIRINFFPILESLVSCARAVKFDRSHIAEASQALLDLNAYFSSERHWSYVWMSSLVKQRWRELWLSEDVHNARPLSEWLDAEHPTLLHLDTALDMWHRYLFIFSLPVPERIPDVFQASHHFAGASYGVLCKLRRNCSLHVWDHCISWREVTVFLSCAMSFDSPFVCSSLMQLSRMTSVLILHYADVVLPCADFFVSVPRI